MFCRNCGEVILDTDITCPNCGFAAGSGLKYCAQCGSETPPGAMICEICGNTIGAMPGAQPQPTAFQQAPQPTAFQQAPQPTAFQQPPQPTAFQQPGTQQYPTDPNAAAYGQQPGYGQPGAYQQPNVNGQYYGAGVTYKSKLTAGLLGIFLGSIGVHNFYLGYTTKAVIQLLLTLLSCGTLAVVSEIWGFVEGIMILTGSINQDGKGLPLKD